MKRKYRDIICIIVNSVSILIALKADINGKYALLAGIASLIFSILPFFVTLKFSLFNKKLEKGERIADMVIIAFGSSFVVICALLIYLKLL